MLLLRAQSLYRNDKVQGLPLFLLRYTVEFSSGKLGPSWPSLQITPNWIVSHLFAAVYYHVVKYSLEWRNSLVLQGRQGSGYASLLRSSLVLQAKSWWERPKLLINTAAGLAKW